MSFYRNQLEDYLKTLDVNADIVVDVGGGAWPVRIRVKSWNVGKYVIYDKAIEQITNDLVTIDYDLNEVNPVPSGVADIVFCLEVFEYVWNPLQAVKNIYSLLKEGGVAYITFPFVYPIHEPIEHDYLRYTARGVMVLLQKAGFEEEDIIIKTRIDRTGKLQEFYKADGMHPSKNMTNHNVTGWIVEVKK